MKRIVKYLGIDFGSSKTSVVGFVEGQSAPVVFLNEERGVFSFPSAMREGKDKTYYFESAYERGEDGKLYSGLKEELAVKDVETETKLRVRKFLAEIAKRVKSTGIITDGEEYFDFSQLKGICYGYPAYVGKGTISNYCRKMGEILKELFKPEGVGDKDFHVYKCPEPVLAACAYHQCRKGEIHAGEKVLILDFGGYTLDVTLMEAVVDKGGEVKLVNMKSCVSVNNKKERYGGGFVGKDITMELCGIIYEKTDPDRVKFDFGVEKAKCEFFEKAYAEDGYVDGATDYKDGDGVVSYRLRYNATERISKADEREGRFCVGFKGEKRAKHIALDRNFNNVINMIKTYLGSINEDMQETFRISHVLFTGGTAKMKPLRDIVAEELKEWRETVEGDFVLWMDDRSAKDVIWQPWDEDGKDARYPLSSDSAVALGAALVAAGVCEPSKDRATQKAGADKKKIASLTSENQKLKMQIALEKLKLGTLSEEEIKKLPKKIRTVWETALKSFEEDQRFAKLSEAEKKALLDALAKMKITE